MSQDLLQDVDNMVRQERLAALWQAYGSYIIVAVATVLVLAGLHQGYQAWFHAQSERQTKALLAAIEGPNPATALTSLTETTSGSMRALVLIGQGGTALQAGDRDVAIAAYQNARNDAQADKKLRDLATLLWVRLVADHQDYQAEDLLAALRPLTTDTGHPFYALAQLEAAMIIAHRQQDGTTARQILQSLVRDPNLPFTLTERAQALLDVLDVRLPPVGARS